MQPEHSTRLAAVVLSGVAALAALTVAHAARPHRLGAAPAAQPTRLQPVQPLVKPPPTPVLIAFHPPLPDGEVGSPFGLRRMPWEDQPRLHAGVDMIAPAPKAVLAAADGVVTRVGADPGHGKFVELKHAQGLTTLYGHLDRFAPHIVSGGAVKAGTVVGRLGSTGASTGMHLHFEIRDAQDRPLNPELFIGRAFASAHELPLREARRVPGRVRVAYVSRIPKTKQALMQAKLADEAEGRKSIGRAHRRPHMRLRS